MIKFKELSPYLEKWAVHPDENFPVLNLDMVQEGLREGAKRYDLPLTITRDEVNAGGLFKKEIIDVLVLSHPEHPKDYLKFVFQLRSQGEMQILQLDQMGQSKQLKKLQVSQSNEQHRGERWNNSDHSVSNKIMYNMGNRIGNAIATLGMNKAKIAAEEEYYELLTGLFNQFRN